MSATAARTSMMFDVLQFPVWTEIHYNIYSENILQKNDKCQWWYVSSCHIATVFVSRQFLCAFEFEIVWSLSFGVGLVVVRYLAHTHTRACDMATMFGGRNPSTDYLLLLLFWYFLFCTYLAYSLIQCVVVGYGLWRCDHFQSAQRNDSDDHCYWRIILIVIDWKINNFYNVFSLKRIAYDKHSTPNIIIDNATHSFGIRFSLNTIWKTKIPNKSSYFRMEKGWKVVNFPELAINWHNREKEMYIVGHSGTIGINVIYWYIDYYFQNAWSQPRYDPRPLRRKPAYSSCLSQ